MWLGHEENATIPEDGVLGAGAIDVLAAPFLCDLGRLMVHAHDDDEGQRTKASWKRMLLLRYITVIPSIQRPQKKLMTGQYGQVFRIVFIRGSRTNAIVLILRET